MKKLNVSWISAGVSSFIAGYISRDEIDELDPHAGRMQDEIMEECGIACQVLFE